MGGGGIRRVEGGGIRRVEGEGTGGEGEVGGDRQGRVRVGAGWGATVFGRGASYSVLRNWMAPDLICRESSSIFSSSMSLPVLADHSLV